MKHALALLALLLPLAPLSAQQQEVDGSEINREIVERDLRVSSLPIEEQLKLRAAQVKAADDPKVNEMRAKRDEAIRNYRAAVREAMIKADPSVEPILDKVAIPGQRGTGDREEKE